MLTESLVLHPSAVLVQVSELPERIRRNLACEADDYALSKRNSRAATKIIDADAAALVREFREPSTLAAAVARLSRIKDENAETLLESAIPLTLSLISGGMLVSADSVPSSAGTLLRAGDQVDGWEVVRCVQALEDTEVHQVRAPREGFGALKICRAGHAAARYVIEREVRILRTLDACATPALLGCGHRNGQPYLITEWFCGTEADRVCADLRMTADRAARRDLLRITGAILKAYAHLHELGLIHGDVHPRNILIDRNDQVRIIDLGSARVIRGKNIEDTERAGISYFWEPELACAVLRGTPPPPATFTGEQYSLGALLYLLLTGSHYIDFVVEKEAMLRGIAGEAVVPFTRRGIPAWPAAERLLKKALSRRPNERFASVAEFSSGWDLIKLPEPEVDASAVPHELERIGRELVASTAIEAGSIRAPLHPPTASITYGSAGIGLALHRIACASENGELFAQADCWSARALRDLSGSEAFYSDELDVTSANIGSCSIYHGPAGVYLTAALIAAARGDTLAWTEAIRNFVEICRVRCEVLDLTLGVAGALLGCALLLEARDDRRVRGIGADLCAQLSQSVDRAPISESPETSILGVAHGWAGILYALTTWCVVAHQPFPSSLQPRLQELSGFAYPVGRGLSWPRDLQRSMENSEIWGWCNGSAGFVFLWIAAYRAYKDRHYLDLAERAAWNVWELPAASPSLCCGIAGQTYALLNCYRCSDDEKWLRRALQRASSAKSVNWRRESLYKGDLGLAVLAFDLENPRGARMPMFELDA